MVKIQDISKHLVHILKISIRIAELQTRLKNRCFVLGQQQEVPCADCSSVNRLTTKTYNMREHNSCTECALSAKVTVESLDVRERTTKISIPHLNRFKSALNRIFGKEEAS